KWRTGPPQATPDREQPPPEPAALRMQPAADGARRHSPGAALATLLTRGTNWLRHPAVQHRLPRLRTTMTTDLLRLDVRKRPSKLRFDGRILFLVDDADLVRRQLEGEDLELT